MRLLPAATAALLASCSTPPRPAPPTPSPPEVAAAPLAADTPRTTAAGTTFIAPAGWRVTAHGPTTILEAPESGSRIVIVEVPAAGPDEAMALAWAKYGAATRPLRVASPWPERNGWAKTKVYEYVTSPNEKRTVMGAARSANGLWTVTLNDLSEAVAEKRAAQLRLIAGRLLPRGYQRESFTGRKAHALDEARVKSLLAFIESGRRQLGVPGVALGLVQDGKTVFAGGAGVRTQGKPEPVDGDTRFLIASNTKALTTLLLARLVDEGKLTWDTPVHALLPQFKLGNAETTRQVLVKHLICACTGIPRQDMEWLLQYGGLTPEKALATLGTMQPTSKFGELYQYSNPMAAAGGFVAGHVAYPSLELGRAYDEAMRTRVFEPLGMASTTMDFQRAGQGNAASPHGLDVDANTRPALGELNASVVPVRPAGAAWSTVRDLLRYVQLELDEGKLPDGRQLVSREALLARRAPQAAVGNDATYGMGLMVNTEYGTEVVHHGGDMVGFHSDMLWLPEHRVGAVIFTNSDPGALLRTHFRRKLLEVLFDGRPEADAALVKSAQARFDQARGLRKLVVVPAAPAEAAALAARYQDAALGEIAVGRTGGATVFDFGEWKSEVASLRNADGTISFITIAPGVVGIEFIAGGAAPRRTLTLRDAQHEYVFAER